MLNKKGLLWSILVIVIVIAVTIPYYIYEQRKPILIGGLFDLTGPTADVGVDYSLGIKEAVQWINDQGGIHKKKIKLISNDYAYDIPKARALYQEYIKKEKIELIQGWGTGDTEALMPVVNRDSVVYMSASYSAALTDPFYTPYNFFIGTDYSTSLRLAVKFIKETNPDPAKTPKMVFIYPDHPFGRAPIPAGKRMAAEMGIKYGQDQFVPLNAKSAKKELEAVKAYAPDWVWLGGTLNSCAVVIRDAGEIGLDAKFIVNAWGFDETLLQKAGPYANGRVYGVMPCAMWRDNVPGMKDILAAGQKYGPGKEHTIHYVKAWLSMMLMAEALKKTGGNASGYAVREALESVRNYNLGDLSAPITYTERDHRPNTTIKIYKIEKNSYVFVSEMSMPRDNRFIGW